MSRRSASSGGFFVLADPRSRPAQRGRGPRRRNILAVTALAVVAALATVALAVARLRGVRPTRVAVSGASMEPTLRRGDWLIVDAAAYRRRAPTVGDIVVARDPRLPDRVVIKRVVAVMPDGDVELRGDAGDASTDSRSFGPVPAPLVVGRVLLRYWPPRRFGRVR